jgi:hypothetical protein
MPLERLSVDNGFQYLSIRLLDHYSFMCCMADSICHGCDMDPDSGTHVQYTRSVLCAHHLVLSDTIHIFPPSPPRYM